VTELLSRGPDHREGRLWMSHFTMAFDR